MSDARPQVHTDALDTLGTIITRHERRDAIHVAVEPVQASEFLAPGTWVALDQRGWAYAVDRGEGVGIVDPFIDATHVSPEQWFWLLVRPREITSLRHVWTHPAFSDEPSFHGGMDDDVEPPSAAAERAESLAWLENYADDVGIGMNHMLAALTNGAYNPDGLDAETYGEGWTSGESYVTIYGSDAGGAISPDVWFHITKATGVIVAPDSRPSYFSCSC